MRRVLVCGGRDYKDVETFNRVLTAAHHAKPIGTIIHGCALGADMLADDWARAWKVECLRFKPNWKLHGNAAGPIRNQQMLDEGKPDLVIAFPGGKGTANMKKLARKAKVTMLNVNA